MILSSAAGIISYDHALERLMKIGARLTTFPEAIVQTRSSSFSVGGPRWYVVQCKPREERRALENLERQQFLCYLPTLSVEKLRQGTRVEVEECLFPGYLFIHLDEVRDDWHPIRSTRGVIQIVRFNLHPLPVRDELVETIRQRLEVTPPKIPYLQPGERVRLIEGCFSNLEAIFVADDGTERVTLLMNILHSEQKVTVPLASVRKCGNE
jgi:transcriptional antiterminator RfaH